MEFDLTENAILTLLRSALFGEQAELPPETDWDALYREARAQAIVPLIASVLPDSVPPDKRTLWELEASQQYIHYCRILEEQERLVGLFREAGIPLLILKGCAAAVYYPDPSLRTMGDIDFIVPQGRFLDAIALMKAMEYTWCEAEEEYRGGRHVEFSRNGVSFELHHHFSNDVFDMDAYINDAFSHPEQGEVDGYAFPMPPSLANGVVLLSHMCQHLRIKMGLRQVLDWMMFVSKVLDDNYWEKTFRQAAESFGMVRFTKVVTQMCRKYLGLEKDISWCGDADEQLCDELLQSLFESGNFARKLDESNDVETVLNGVKRLGFFSFLQMRGLSHWKAAEKHRWLRPFAWLYQIFRYAWLTIRRGLGFRQLEDQAAKSSRFNGLLKELGLI